MYRSTKVLLQPTAGQRAALGDLLQVQCELYNAALEERRGAWQWERRAVSRFEQYRELKYLHELRPDVMRFGVKVCRGTLTRLDLAFAGFFRRVKAGETPGYPRFKTQRRWDSVRWPDDHGWKVKDNRLYVQGVGHVRFRTSRRGVRGTPKTLVVIREGRRWFAAVQCEVEPSEALPSTGRSVGIDLGVASLLTTSDGEHVDNPRFFADGRAKLADEERALSRKQRGSARRRAQVQRVAAAHRKIRNRRRDHAHKLSRRLVNDFDVIIHEDLRVSNMTRRPNPRMGEDGTFEPNGAAAKSGLNRSIHDAGWGQLVAFITYKAEEAGRETIAVNPRHTSQRCGLCGHVAKENRVTQAKFVCVQCGYAEHADVNAAKNILRLGLSQRPTALSE